MGVEGWGGEGLINLVWILFRGWGRRVWEDLEGYVTPPNCSFLIHQIKENLEEEGKGMVPLI